MYIIIFLDMFERKLEDLKKLSRHILFLLCTVVGGVVTANAKMDHISQNSGPFLLLKSKKSEGEEDETVCRYIILL